MEDNLDAKLVATGFERHGTDEVVASILRYSRLDRNVTENVLQAICERLKLKGWKSDGTLERFYSEVIIGEKTRVLLVAGVLLSQGGTGVKAKALYEAYDVQATGSIEASSVQEMMRELMSVVVSGFRYLCPSEDIEDAAYFNTLNSRIVPGSQQACTELLESKLSLLKPVFLQRLTRFNHGSLLQPYGLRQYLHRLNKA